MATKTSALGAPAPLALDRSAQAKLRALREVKAQLAALKEREVRLVAGLKDAMGDHESATVKGVPVVTYRRSIRSAVDLTVLKKAYPEIARECTRDKEIRTFMLVEPE